MAEKKKKKKDKEIRIPLDEIGEPPEPRMPTRSTDVILEELLFELKKLNERAVSP